MSRLPVIANLDPYRQMLRVASFIATALIMVLCAGDLLFRGTPFQAFDIQNLTGFGLTLAALATPESFERAGARVVGHRHSFRFFSRQAFLAARRSD